MPRRSLGASSFDIITTNPPYMIGQHGLTNPEEAKAIARHEILCNLTDIMRESARILKPGGTFFYGTPPVSSDRNHLLYA